jgi:Holliday junction resolvasome RuvABC endonuclease subunit
MSLLGLDLATRRIGWCVGTGEIRPAAGTWRYDHVGDDLGLLAEMFMRDLDALADQHQPTHIVYESPILLPSDRLLPLRKIYGLGMQVEHWGRRNNVHVSEEGPRALKKLLTGNHKAKKEDMVAVAIRMGISLPDGESAKDAADAFACWLCAVQHYAKPFLPRWDALLYGSRGGLL